MSHRKDVQQPEAGKMGLTSSLSDRMAALDPGKRKIAPSSGKPPFADLH